MPSRTANTKTDKKRTSTSTKSTSGDVSRGKSEEFSSVAKAPVKTQVEARASIPSPPLTPSPSPTSTSDESILKTPSSTPDDAPGLSSLTQADKPLPPAPALDEAFDDDDDDDEQYTELESHLRRYSRDVYSYTLTLYHAQRIDATHRGRAATLAHLKRAVSDIAIPMKAMAVGDAQSSKARTY